MQCPECAKKGQVQYLRFHFISLSESVEKCNLPTCFYPFSHFRYRNYYDHTIYRYERVPAALVVQTEPEPSANETKELLDTFNLNWLDEPNENVNTTGEPPGELIEDYSFNESGLSNFLSMVNESVNNPYDIEAIIDDICKDSANTSAAEDEEYTLLELKTFSKPSSEEETVTNSSSKLLSESTDPAPATTPRPLTSPPTCSFVPTETQIAPAKPRKKYGRRKKMTDSGFKFNIIRSSTTSSSSSSSSPRSDFPTSNSDNIPKLSKCLAQIHSITALARESSSSSSSNQHSTAVKSATLIKRDHQNANEQLKTILEQKEHIHPLDLMNTLDSIKFIPDTTSNTSSPEKYIKTPTIRKAKPKNVTKTRDVEEVIERPFYGFTKRDLARPRVKRILT